MIDLNAPLSLLGERSPNAFMASHWQRHHQLIRRAIPDFSGVLSPSEVLSLSKRDDVESRLLIRTGVKWVLEHGPFTAKQLKALPERNWTILIQGLNHHVPAADELLRKFSFIPYVRLDDVMVSLAAPGGGVGPHFDSYDVFLLQGIGRRRWKVSTQSDLTLRPNMPLKILKNFVPEHDWTLSAGDMLYLPPRYAHDGVALDTCMTYSIGFRAPTQSELAAALFDEILEQINSHATQAQYSDQQLSATTAPGKVPERYVRGVSELLNSLRWNEKTIAKVAARYASEPKPYVLFEAPEPPLSLLNFSHALEKHGVVLHAASILLYDDECAYLNGESQPLRPDLAHFSDNRVLQARKYGRETVAVLYDWFCAGWIALNSKNKYL